MLGVTHCDASVAEAAWHAAEGTLLCVLCYTVSCYHRRTPVCFELARYQRHRALRAMAGTLLYAHHLQRNATTLWLRVYLESSYNRQMSLKGGLTD